MKNIRIITIIIIEVLGVALMIWTSGGIINLLEIYYL